VHPITLPTLITPLAIAGIRNRDLIVGAVVLLALVLLVFLASRRRRKPKLDLHKLEAAEGQRYADEFAALEQNFIHEPEQSAARAKGLCEEVMRRMGFPDRIDSQQRIRDLAGYDREAATALATADKELGGGTEGTERLRRIVQEYRKVVNRLLDLPHAD
jgi:hypothetical protein